MGGALDGQRHAAAPGEGDNRSRRFVGSMGSDYSARPNATMKNWKLEIGNSKSSAGAAIMLALWALFLLSALVISWALDINARVALSGEGTRMLKAEAVACSGAEVALNPTIKPRSPNLNGSLDGGAVYKA